MFTSVTFRIIFYLNIFTFVRNVTSSENQSKSVLDLTWPFNNDTIYWPGSQSFTFTKTIESLSRGYWYSLKDFKAGEHGGTHLDAPYHFNENGWKVGDIPLERFVAKAILIDLSEETNLKGANTTLLPKHLDEWEKVNGKFPQDCILLVKFGWSKFWNKKTQYLGLDESGNLNFPGVSKEAAQKIGDSGKFFGVGVDTASVDPGSSNSHEFFAHRTLLAKNIYALENVRLVEDLPAKGFTLIVSPMKIETGTGAPLRIYAITNQKLFL